MDKAILAIGIAIVVGHLLAVAFRRTRIPDVLVLMLLGIAVGPFGFALASPADFGKVGPVLTTVALIVILFEGGVGLDLRTVGAAMGETLRVTLVTSAATLGLVAVIAWPFLQSWPMSFVLGAILCGTSSAVVMPMVAALGMSERPRAVLALESAITDVLCIVLFVGLLEMVQKGGDIQGLALARSMISSLVVACVIGVAGGFAWLAMLHRVRQLPNSFTLVFAVVFMLYGIAESLGFSGAIAALSFGMTVSNVLPEVVSRFEALRGVRVEQHSEVEKGLFAEAVFLVKLFFFVYLGISLQFGRLEPFIAGAGIVAAVYAARVLITRFTLARQASRREAAIAAVMVPKGLAAAVLASIPLQLGIAGGADLRDLAFAVVGISIIVTSLAVPLLELPPFRQIAHGFLAVFAERPAEAARRPASSTALPAADRG